jgi:Zn-dependent peptidase ImmA (M78 family)
MNSDDRQQAQSFDDEMLPPTAKRRVYERIALKIREFAGAPVDQPLNPWKLAPYVKILVLDLKQIEGLSEESRRTLLGDSGKAWSGGASRPLPDGSRLVFLNPNHTRERQAATLMEEICHVVLGHSPTKLMLAEEAERAVHFRNFDKNQEEVAYAVGAAALIPYFSLRHAVLAGLTSDRIARRFGVSRDLVEYRIKVCRLWADYKQLGRHSG